METKEKAAEIAIADNVIPGFSSKQSLALAVKAANILSQSTLVPKEYQDNVPNCIIALNMANRMNADPLMVMQNLYVVYGRPSWGSQFLISTVNSCGRFTAIRYDFGGKKGTDSWGCRAWAIEKETGERLTGAEVTIGLSKQEGWYAKNGSKWQTMPEQMLMYRAASWWVRAYAPELAMGMQTAEELHDVIDLEANPSGTYEAKVEQEVAVNANTGEVLGFDTPAPETEKEPDPIAEPPKAEAALPEDPGY